MVDDRTPYPADPADELGATAPGPSGSPTQFVAEAAQSLNAETVEASLSAIASARVNSLKTTGSAVGLATVGRDAQISTSAAGILNAKGNATVNQSYVQGFVGAEHVDLHQAASAAVIARTVTFDHSVSAVTMSAETEVNSGFIGILLSGRANVSENARVVLTGRALAVLAAALLGGLGLVAIAVWWGAREIATKLPKVELPWKGRVRDH